MSIQQAFSRLSLWLPAIVIAFAVVANLEMPPLNTTSSSVGAAILSGYVFVISGLSASACWGAVRYKDVFTSLLSWRGNSRLVLWLLIPLLGWAVVAFLAFWGLTYVQVGEWVMPHSATYFLAILLWFAWTIFGISMAWALPRLIAIVVTSIVPFTVTSFAWAVPDYAWRQMLGVPSSCCRLGGEIHRHMIQASAMTLFAIVLFGASLVLYRKRIGRVAVSLLLVVATLLLVSYQTATRVDNYSAAQPRDPAESICEVDICYWPESPQEQIEANRLALMWVRATLPSQWIGPGKRGNRVQADTAIYVGNDFENHIPFGKRGDPLNFQPTANPDEAYHRHLVTLLYRENGDFKKAATTPYALWGRWKNEQLKRGNATPSGVSEAVEKLDQEFYGDAAAGLTN